MSEIPSATNQQVYTHIEASILEDPYQKEVQEDIWESERKKTMYSLLAIGLILLTSNVIGFAKIDALVVENLFSILLIPVVFLGLGLFARLQPMVSAIAGILVIVALTVINYIVLGPMSLIGGWIYKVVALYFIIKSVRHAKEAEDAKKQLERLV